VVSLSHSAPAMTASLGSMSPIPQFRPWTSKHVAILAALGGTLFLGAILLGAALRGERQPFEAAATVASPAAAAIHAPPELVDVSVRVFPPTALVTIDGAAILNGPIRARYPKDSQMHHIVATADGYESKSADVSFASDVAIDLGLIRRASVPMHFGAPLPVVPFPSPPRPTKQHAGIASTTIAAPLSDSAVAPSSPVPPRGDISPAGGRVPLRPIVTSNPYGTP
jgi:hypothetical protein